MEHIEVTVLMDSSLQKNRFNVIFMIKPRHAGRLKHRYRRKKNSVGALVT